MDTLTRLEATIAQRLTASPEESYVAKLHAKGLNTIAQKLGEEATEVVMAAKDLAAIGASDPAIATAQHKLVAEMADLWFHSLIALHQARVRPEQVLAELERREGLSGLDEKAARKAQERGA